MKKVDYWATAPMHRDQMAFFAPTLGEMISEDDPVRVVDEVLKGLDWSSWEAEYDRRRGQPPIHPRHLAAAILYGLCRRIRSSRMLEEACAYRLDFIWLLEGRRPDHTTFAKFRTKFREPLKELFKQLCRIAMTIGLIRLGEVAFDGTRVRADNSRYATRTAQTLEEQLADLEKQFDQMMTEFDASDSGHQEQKAFDNDEDDSGEGDSPTRLPAELADLKQRREKVRDALKEAKSNDEMRRQNGLKNPGQIPTNDRDSRVMPNKEGGFAPNYTPTATTDGHWGFIIDCDVINQVNETSLASESVKRIEESLGEKPERFLTDGGNSTGKVMQEMEERGVEFYAPAKSNQPQPESPACRDDPTEPVAESEWDKLPRNSRKQLDKSCFVYDEEKDQYYCPQGHAMPYEKTTRRKSGRSAIDKRQYRCPSDKCQSCALVTLCVAATCKGGRTVSRDNHEEVRERTASRMASESAKEIYNRRPQIAETPFGTIKQIMGLRQFLLRGLTKVKTEWTWATTAFNLAKLVKEIGRMRDHFLKLAGATGE